MQPSSTSPFAPLAPLARLPPLDRVVGEAKKGLLRKKKSTTVGLYTLAGVVGSGGCGQVCAASVSGLAADFRVAVKVVEVVDDLHKVRREVDKQICCHDHPNIPTCFDLVQTKTAAYVVMELAPDGDLFDFISDNGALTFASAAKVMRQVASAVAHMHARNIAHRDIKPENILLADRRNRMMLCDFGHAVRWDESQPLLTRACGTTRCLPPEMFLVSGESDVCQYNPKAVDVFQLGNLLFFLLTGRFPFEGEDRNDTARNVVSQRFTSALPGDTPLQCEELLMAMLHPDPLARASINDVVAHPFLAGLKHSGSS